MSQAKSHPKIGHPNVQMSGHNGWTGGQVDKRGNGSIDDGQQIGNLVNG